MPPNIRIMVVDDSAVIRGLIQRALKQQPNFEIVATAADGAMAVALLPMHTVDVIILDIEMPNMTGIEALPKLLAISPNTRIVMASTLTQRNASISLQAMSLGAADYLPKPTAMQGDGVEEFYRELISKVNALGQSAQRARLGAAPSQVASPAAPPTTKPSVTTKPVTPVAARGAMSTLPTYPDLPFQALAIASSTGGPQALVAVLSQLKGRLGNVPIFITQHMPATFTTLLAEHLTRDSGKTCKEAVDGETVKPGVIYLAPGNYHMTASKQGETVTLKLDQNPPVNFCRPAADPMFNSLATVYGKRLLGVVLTGMGHDGRDGAQQIVRMGGSVIAQDEATSVVWGMPGAIAEANIARGILPLPSIPAYILRAAGA